MSITLREWHQSVKDREQVRAAHRELKAVAQYYAIRVQDCANVVRAGEEDLQRRQNDLDGERTALASAQHFLQVHQEKLDQFERANAEALAP